MIKKAKENFQQKSVLWSFLVSTLLPCFCSVVILVAVLLPLIMSAASSNDRAREQNTLYVVSAQFDQLSEAALQIQNKIEQSSWIHTLYIDHVINGKEVPFEVSDQILKDLSLFAAQWDVVSYVSLQFSEETDSIYSSLGIFRDLQFFQTHMPEKQQYFFFPMEESAVGLDTVFFQDQAILLCRLPVSDVDGGRTKGTINVIYRIPLIEKRLEAAVNGCVSAFRIRSAAGECLWEYQTETAEPQYTVSCSSIDGDYFYEIAVPRSIHYQTICRTLPPLLLVVLLDLAVCVLSSLYFSRRNYQPLQTMVQRLDGSTQDGRNEWNSLNAIIDHMLEEKENAIHSLDGLRPLARQRIINGLLRGDADFQNDLPSQLRFCRMELDGPLFSAAALLMPFSQIMGQNEEEYRTRQITELAMEAHLTSLQSGLALHAYLQCSDMDHYTLLISNQSEDALMTYCLRILESCGETFGLRDVLIGLGNPVQRMDEIYRSADQASSALRYGAINRTTPIISYSDITSQTVTDYVYPLSEELRLSRFLAAGDRENAKALLNTLIKDNQRHFEADPETMGWFYHDLCSTVMRSVQGLGVTLNRKQQKKYLRQLNSTAQLQALSEQLVDGVCAQLEIKQADVQDIGQDILDYIEENLYNPALSLDMVAEQFQKSTAYISVLFKRLKGVNYSEYINHARVLYAMDLMAQQHMDMEQVCAAAGFGSMSSFRRNFIKYAHQNPGDFLSR